MPRKKQAQSPKKKATTPKNKAQSLLASIEAVVRDDKAVISSDSSTVVVAVQDALRNDRTATFYVSRDQFQVVMRWYWTNKRIKELGMEAVSQEEKHKIERKLGVKDKGSLYSNRIKCACGEVYGAFEFIEQGIREHGMEMVGAVLELKVASIIRINPPNFAICAHCNQNLMEQHYYMWIGDSRYACCMSGH